METLLMNPADSQAFVFGSRSTILQISGDDCASSLLLLDHSSLVPVQKGLRLAVPTFDITYRSPLQKFSLCSKMRLTRYQLGQFFTPTRCCSVDTELIC